MTEQELIERLRRLDASVEPDVTFRHDLHASLRNATGSPANLTMSAGTVTVDLVEPSPNRRTRRSGWLLAAATFSAVVVAGVALSLIPGSDPADPTPSLTAPESTTIPPEDAGAGTPVFSRPLPWVLVFDNGTNGVRVFNLSTGEVNDRQIEGARGGDQPYRLTLHDNHLVVGVDQIFAYDILRDLSSSLATASYHMPAAEPARVWVVDYMPGYGDDMATVWQIHVDGGLASESQVLNVPGIPIRGIPGGLALQSDSGIVLWDFATSSVIATLGSGWASVSDVTPDGRIVWCEDPCTQLMVTDITTGAVSTLQHPDSDPFGLASFSDDGRYLAAIAGLDVVVADLDTGESEVVMTFPDDGPPSYIAWAPGPLLFASEYSYAEGEGTLGYYSPVNRRSEIVHTPHGGTLSFVVLPTTQAGQLLGTDPPIASDVIGNGACPVTIPDGLFTPPMSYPADPVAERYVWYGTPELWTFLRVDGTTSYRKSVWWSTQFPGGMLEERPEIHVTWENLTDPDQEPIDNEGIGTNAFTPEEGDFIIAGIDPELPGCWKVTATYKGATLSYVYENP